MHYVTLKADFDMGNGTILKPETYLVTDVNAAQMLLRKPKDVVVEGRFVEPERKITPRTIMIPSGGAIGDLLLMSPVLYELVEVGHSVTVCASKPASSVLNRICNVVEYPITKRESDRYDCIVSLEYAHEERIHMTDVFAQALGITWPFNKAPVIQLSDDEVKQASARMEKTGRKRVAFQSNATARCRTYAHNVELVLKLVEAGYDVYLLGAPGEIKWKMPEHVYNCTSENMALRASISVLANCDGFVGPDSGLLHAAGALGVPAVGLFGPFPHDARTKYEPSVFALQGKTGCDMAPCWHHPVGKGHFPAGGPCNAQGHCVALASIEPDRIIAKLNQIVRETQNE